MQITRVTIYRDNGNEVTRIRRRNLFDTNNRKSMKERVDEVLDCLARSQDRFDRWLGKKIDYIT